MNPLHSPVASVGGSATAFFPQSINTYSIPAYTVPSVNRQRHLPERSLPPQYVYQSIPGPSTSSTGKSEDIPESFQLRRDGFEDSSSLVASCAKYAEEQKRREEERSSYGAFQMADGRSYNSTTRRGALYCRTGVWLEILPDREYERQRRQNGRVNSQIRGKQGGSGKFSLLEFISVAIGLVSIRGVEANRFVCMDNTSRLYAVHPRDYSTECVFLEEMLENYYNLYSSCAHYPQRETKTFKPWYVALRKDGRPMQGRRSRKRRKASHFLVVHYDLTPALHPPKDDMTRIVSSSIRNQPRGNSISEVVWVTVPGATPIGSSNRLITPVDRRKERHKKYRDRRLRKERMERERRKEEIERKREEELQRQRSLEATRTKYKPFSPERIRIASPPEDKKERLSGAGLKINNYRT